MASSSRVMEEFSMAFVTAPSQDKAKELASGLVRLVYLLVYNSVVHRYIVWAIIFHKFCLKKGVLSLKGFQWFCD